MAKSAGHHHITPLSTYLMVGVALLVLTGVTVGVSFIDLGAWNAVVAILIASVKAMLVALFFMHLLYDNKFFMIIFATALAFLTILIMFSMFDVLNRGELDEMREIPIQKEAVIYQDKDKKDTLMTAPVESDTIQADTVQSDTTSSQNSGH